jgi:hypothetical protein
LRRQEAAEDSARGEGIPGQVDDLVVEGLQGMVCRLDGQHAVGSLVIQVERRGPAECGEQRIGRKGPRGHVQESLGEFKRIGPFVGIESQHEVGLDVGYVLQDQIDVFGHLANFGHPEQRAGLRFVAQGEPGFNAGKDAFE